MSKGLSKQYLLLLFSLYTTQFIGVAFFIEAFIGILRQNNVALENIGLIYLLGLFSILRFLWAPFVDSISFKKMGHYKGWIIIFHILMILTLFITAFFNLLENMALVISLGAFYSFFAATQYIALDAFVIKTVPPKHRASANAVKAAGGMIGMVLGGGVGLIAYTHLGWMNTLFLMVFAFILALIQVFFFKEEQKNQKDIGNNIDYKQFIEFWKGKRRIQWLLFLIIYPITISSAFGLTMPMLVDLGWGLDKIGFYLHIVGYGIGVLASFGASWLMNKFGKRNILIVAAIGQVIGMLLLLPLAYGYDSTSIVMLAVGTIFAFYTPSIVVMATLFMDEANEKTPASQYAIQHSFYLFITIMYSSLAVSLSGSFGYSNIILAVSIMGLLAIYASFKIELAKENLTN